MPAQKRPFPSQQPPPPSEDRRPDAPVDFIPDDSQPKDGVDREDKQKQKPLMEQAPNLQQQQQQQQQPMGVLPEQQLPVMRDESDGGGGVESQSEDDEAAEKPEFVLVKLSDLRKEVQCPICLGIIRKTRTVMECLHRFCRECIDKSMRLGNNECPACRTHCASRRSLRDDPKYDFLIAALYPDIDKYEEEELAFHEEEKSRNKKIQAYIAETLQRQSEALGRRRTSAKATAAAFARKSRNHGQNSYLHGRGRSVVRDAVLAAASDDDDDEEEEEEEANGNDGSKGSSSADEPSPDRRLKRFRKWSAPRSPPARTAVDADVASEENDDFDFSRENIGKSPLQAGSREMPAWGKNGARSQTRHGNTSSSSARSTRSGRITKLMQYLRNLDENDDEFGVPLTLVPFDKESIPNLQQPYLCCQPTLSIRHLCEFIALHTSVQPEVQIYARKPPGGNSAMMPLSSVDPSHSDPFVGLHMLEGLESLAALHAAFTRERGELVLIYHLKTQS